MNYQQKTLPEGAKKIASTPVLTEKTVLKPMLKKHLAPRGKCGWLTVIKGALQFVWEDSGETFDAAPGHPVLIEPERFHHLTMTGPVEFKVEFYELPGSCIIENREGKKAVRPGEQFIRS